VACETLRKLLQPDSRTKQPARRVSIVTNKTAAIRYARALLDVGVKEKADLDQIEHELSQFADLFKQYPLLEKVLLNPGVPVQRKRAAVADLLGRAQFSAIVSKLLTLLADRDRLVLVPDLLAAYRERLLDHQHIVRAEVTTSVPLDAQRASAIQRGLATLTGRYPEVEGGPLVEMPDLVRCYPMPAAHGSGRQEKIDRGERRAETSPVGGVHRGIRAVHLAVKPALRMRDHPECRNEGLDAVAHSSPIPPLSLQSRQSSSLPR